EWRWCGRTARGGSAPITPGTRPCSRTEGKPPLLRKRAPAPADTANTPARRLYHCVQMMYLKDDVARYRKSYLGLLGELRAAAPDAADLIEAADHQVAQGALYKALREIKKLMKREEELAA